MLPRIFVALALRTILPPGFGSIRWRLASSTFMYAPANTGAGFPAVFWRPSFESFAVFMSAASLRHPSQRTSGIWTGSDSSGPGRFACFFFPRLLHEPAQGPSQYSPAAPAGRDCH